MGTQQLLLIVLGIIIVGTGVAIGINIFDAAAAQSYRDAISQDCLHLASAAQGYYGKPAMLGGGGSSFDGIQITDCGLTEAGDNLTGENMNATYVIAGSGKTLTVTAASKTEVGRSIVLTCDMVEAGGNRISISYENW